MPQNTATSGVPAADRPLYVVYGYMRDAARFATERQLPMADVLSVNQISRLQGQARKVILVDTDHRLPTTMMFRWHDIMYIANYLNRVHNRGATETIWWAS